jgi:hypothetical protein
MIFGDNQTKHFYVIPASNGYAVKNLEDSNLFRLILNQDNNQKVTSDVIDRKLIKKIKINEVKPTYFRTWTVAAPSAAVADTTYHIYFYLENMTGFGMQDRWDRVATYTAKTGDSAAVVMQHLAVDLWGKLNAAGPIKDDFTVSYGGTPVTKAMFENGTLPTAVSGTNIVVAENPNGPSFKGGLSELDIRMHTTPYVYNVTMSTFDGTSAWGGQKEIRGVEAAANGTYISSASKVMAMELYFLRNRGDLYDLNKDFYTSILNENQQLTANATYYTLDIDYAFSDTLGFTYHSDKQLSIACGGSGAFAALQALRLAILNDSNENAYSASSNVTYSNAESDND